MNAMDIVARAIAVRAATQLTYTFVELGQAGLPDTSRIETIGHSDKGWGAATYIADELATVELLTAHPAAVFKAQGRVLRLLGTDGSITPEQVGCPPYKPGVNQQPYIQAAINYAQAVGLDGVLLTQPIYELWCPVRRGDLVAAENHSGSFLLIQAPVSLKSNQAGRTTLHCKGPHGGSLETDYQVLSDTDQETQVIWRGPGIKIAGGGVDRQHPASDLVRPSILLQNIILHSDATQGGDASSAMVQDSDHAVSLHKGITCDHDGTDAVLRIENVDVSGFLGDCISLSNSETADGMMKFIGRNIVLKQSTGCAIALHGVDIVDVDGLAAEKCSLSVFGSIGRDHGHLRNARFRDCGPGTIYGGSTADTASEMFQPLGDIHLRLENCGDLNVGANLKAQIDAIDTRVLAVATGPDTPIRNVDAHIVSTAHRAVLDGSLHLAAHPDGQAQNVENCSFKLDVRRTSHAVLNGFHHKSMIVFGSASYGARNDIRVRGDGGGELITISKPLTGMRVKVVDDGVDTSLATAPARFDATATATPEFQHVWLRAEFGGSAGRFGLATPSTSDFAEGHEAIIEHRDAASPDATLVIDNTVELVFGGRVKLRARKVAGRWDVIEQGAVTQPAQPVAPGLVSDLAIASLTSSSVTLTFTGAERATSHEYRLDGGVWSALSADKAITGLLPLTNYTVQVRGVDGALQGAASAAIPFATPAEKDVTPPLITSDNPSGIRSEGQAIGGTLTANEAVSWAVTGPDAGRVRLDAGTGAWSLESTDYEAKTSYVWTFTATDKAGNRTVQPVAITISNVAEVILAPQTLSAATLTEGAAQGTAVGTLRGSSAGSTLSLIGNAGGRFQLVGTTIQAGPTATDFEANASHQITVRETHVDAPSPGYRDTALTIAISNVAEQPSLGALSLSPNFFPEKAAVTINIKGATAGSAISLASGALPPGLTLNGAARIISGTPTTPGTSNFALGEALTDSPNSGRTTALSLAVTVAEAQPEPVTASMADFQSASYSGDFTGASDVLTVAAASPRSAVARNGAVQTFAADTLRLTDAGVKVSHAQPAQLATFPSDASNAIWSKTNITVDAATYLAPDGVSQFSKVIPSTTSGMHILSRSLRVVGSQAVALNVLAEFDPEYPYLMVMYDSGNGANRNFAVYDLEAGRLYDGQHRIGSGSVLTEERIVKLRPNLALIQLLYSTQSGTSARVFLSPLPASLYPDAAASPIRTDSSTVAVPSYVGDGVKGQRLAVNVASAAGLDRVPDFTFGTAACAADQLAAGRALVSMLNASTGALRLRLWDTFSPLDKTGLPLLVTNTGEAWLAQHSDTAVKATIGGVSMVTQLGSGSWMSGTVDVVLAWSGTTIRLCANNGPVATMTATKPAITAARLLSNADGSAITDGTILSIEHRSTAMTAAEMQEWSAGLLDNAETFAFWHDSASVAVTAGKLVASTSFAGAGTLAPSAGNEPTVIDEVDALTRWIAFRSGKRATIANPGLLDGGKKIRFDFQARPTDAATLAASEFGANVILSQGDFSIRHVDTGMRVILPHTATALIVYFANCWFENDAACYSVTIDPAAADAGKVELRRNGVAIAGTVSTPSVGRVVAQTATMVVGARESGAEYGAFDLCALAGCEVKAPRSSGAATHDRITKRHYDQVARCQLVAGGDHYEAMFAGSDGSGLTLDYINVPSVSGSDANSIGAYTGAAGHNKLLFALFAGPTTATGGTDGITQPLNLDVQHQIITGMGAGGLPIFAGRKINYGSGSINPHHNLIEHIGICPAYHTSGANRIGADAGNSDGLCFAGDLPSGASTSFEVSKAPEYCFARNLLVWGSQDEAISMTGWARHIYAMDNLIIAMVAGTRPSESSSLPSSWWSNEGSHAYPGLIGYGANACFTGRELMFDVQRRAREWDASDINIMLDIVGRQQNTFATGPYSQGSELGFASYGSKGEHTTGLIENDIAIDFIGIGHRNGRATVATKRPLLSNLWNPVMVSRIGGRAQGVATAFIGGPMFTDSHALGAQRQLGTSVATNTAVSRQSLRTSPAFVEARTQPPMLTDKFMRQVLRDTAGPRAMPAWVKERMDTIERNDSYDTQGMLTSAYNDRAGLLGNTVTQVDPAAFAAQYLAPRKLAWGQKASAEVLLPAYRELQELFARRGAERFI
jgi:hypothetical protein